MLSSDFGFVYAIPLSCHPGAGLRPRITRVHLDQHSAEGLVSDAPAGSFSKAVLISGFRALIRLNRLELDWAGSTRAQCGHNLEGGTSPNNEIHYESVSFGFRCTGKGEQL